MPPAFLIQEQQQMFAVSSSLKAQWPFYWWQIPQHQSHRDQTETAFWARKNIKTKPCQMLCLEQFLPKSPWE